MGTMGLATLPQLGVAEGAKDARFPVAVSPDEMEQDELTVSEFAAAQQEDKSVKKLFCTCSLLCWLVCLGLVVVWHHLWCSNRQPLYAMYNMCARALAERLVESFSSIFSDSFCMAHCRSCVSNVDVEALSCCPDGYLWLRSCLLVADVKHLACCAHSLARANSVEQPQSTAHPFLIKSPNKVYPSLWLLIRRPYLLQACPMARRVSIGMVSLRLPSLQMHQLAALPPTADTSSFVKPAFPPRISYRSKSSETHQMSMLIMLSKPYPLQLAPPSLWPSAGSGMYTANHATQRTPWAYTSINFVLAHSVVSQSLGSRATLPSVLTMPSSASYCSFKPGFLFDTWRLEAFIPPLRICLKEKTCFPSWGMLLLRQILELHVEFGFGALAMSATVDLHPTFGMRCPF